MVPSFIARRIRWIWLAGVAGAVWMNRRDAARWWRFAARSVADRRRFDLSAWMTEARVRAAVTADPVLRADPDFDDVEVHQGEVTVRTAGTANWDAGAHLDTLRKVKGVTQVSCQPGAHATSPTAATVTTPAAAATTSATVPLDEMDATFD